MPTHVISSSSGTFDAGEFDTSIVVPKTRGTGLKIGHESPTYGWNDMLGEITVRGIGAADPDFVQYGATNIYAFRFSATVEKEVWINFHVPHDYAPDTDIYFHAHWSNGEATPNTGNVVWGFDYTFAKGFNQGNFGATSTVTATQACPATRYRHNIAETDAVTLSGLEVDSLILVRIYRKAADAADTCSDAVFLHMADIHYQSTGVPTKNKAPDFYA